VRHQRIPAGEREPVPCRHAQDHGCDLLVQRVER